MIVCAPVVAAYEIVPAYTLGVVPVPEPFRESVTQLALVAVGMVVEIVPALVSVLPADNVNLLLANVKVPPLFVVKLPLTVIAADVVAFSTTILS